MKMKKIWSLALFSLLIVPSFATAAEIRVTTNEDDYNIIPACSLREAVISANTDAAFGGCTAGSGNDVIILEANTTYVLRVQGPDENAAARGDLDILNNVTIRSTDLMPATIQLEVGFNDRVFDIQNRSVVNMSSIILVGSATTGLYNASTPATANGGAIYLHNSSRLNINNTNISNFVTTGNGGAIFVENGSDFSIARAYIDNNRAVNGGGVYCDTNTSGSCAISGATLSRNVASQNGGGIAVMGGADVGVSTISGNQALNGGGIYHGLGTECLLELDRSGNPVGSCPVELINLNLTHVTIAHNSASRSAGGILNQLRPGSDAPLTNLRNSVVSNNKIGSDENAATADCSNWISSYGNNFVKNIRGCSVPEGGVAQPVGGPLVTYAGDRFNLDPMLLPLTPHVGGMVHAFENQSPLIGAGNSAYCLGTDQRGEARGTGCDIGAVNSSTAYNLGAGVSMDEPREGAGTRTFMIRAFNYGSNSMAQGMPEVNPNLMKPKGLVLRMLAWSNSGRDVLFDTSSRIAAATGRYVSIRECTAPSDSIQLNGRTFNRGTYLECPLINFAVGDSIEVIANIPNEAFFGQEVYVQSQIVSAGINRDFEAINDSATLNQYTPATFIETSGPTVRDYSTQVSPCEINVVRGASSNRFFSVVQSRGGFSAAVNIDFVATPTSAGLNFNRATIPEGGKWVEMNLSIPTDIPLGVHEYKVRFNGGDITHENTCRLNVIAPRTTTPETPTGTDTERPVLGFNLNLSSNTLSVAAGAQGNVQANIVRSLTFTRPISMSVLTALPTGVTVNFNNQDADTRTLNIVVDRSVTARTLTLNIKALGESVERVASLTLNILPVATSTTTGGASSDLDSETSSPSSSSGGCNLGQTTLPMLPYSLLSIFALAMLRLRLRNKK